MKKFCWLEIDIFVLYQMKFSLFQEVKLAPLIKLDVTFIPFYKKSFSVVTQHHKIHIVYEKMSILDSVGLHKVQELQQKKYFE